MTKATSSRYEKLRPKFAEYECELLTPCDDLKEAFENNIKCKFIVSPAGDPSDSVFQTLIIFHP